MAHTVAVMTSPDAALLRTIAAQQNGMFVTADALAAGYSRNMIRHRTQNGDWLVLRRGIYTERPCDAVGGFDAGVLKIAAALAAFDRGCAASHESAARLLGFDVGRRESGAVWLTRGPTCRNGRHTHPGVVERAAQLPPADVMLINGLRCTTPTRTITDLARHLPFADAVAYADLALRYHAVTAGGLDHLLAVHENWPGAAGARRVLRFASGLAESPLESYSRVLFGQSDVPPPELQSVITDHGEFVGRVDFLWPEHRTIGEADGRLKYVEPRALWDEKRREDRLREAGFAVIRWSWNDVFVTPDRLIARIQATLARASGSASQPWR